VVRLGASAIALRIFWYFGAIFENLSFSGAAAGNMLV
jgi:hypothetical protein